MIKTSKQLSAFRQISAAIDHFEKKDYECAITLAGAAGFPAAGLGRAPGADPHNWR